MIGRLLCRLGLHRYPRVCSASMFVLADCVRDCGAERLSRPERWYPAELTHALERASR